MRVDRVPSTGILRGPHGGLESRATLGPAGRSRLGLMRCWTPPGEEAGVRQRQLDGIPILEKMTCARLDDPRDQGWTGGERGTARRQAPCPSPIASTGKRPPGHSALHRPPPRHPHPVPERLSPSLLTLLSTTCHLSPRRRRSLGNTHRLCPLLADHPAALRARRPST